MTLIKRPILLYVLFCTPGQLLAGSLSIEKSSQENQVWQERFLEQIESANSYLQEISQNKKSMSFDISFQPLNGHLGFAPLAPDEIHRSHKIEISEKLYGSWSSFPVAVHEMVHYYRREVQKNDPLWFQEGLASLIENQSTNWKWNEGFYQALINSKTVTLSNIEADYHFESGLSRRASSFYFFKFLSQIFGGEAYIHYLISSPLSGWENILSSAKKLRNRTHTVPTELISRKNLLLHFGIALLMNSRQLNHHMSLIDKRNFSPLIELEDKNIFSFDEEKFKEAENTLSFFRIRKESASGDCEKVVNFSSKSKNGILGIDKMDGRFRFYFGKDLVANCHPGMTVLRIHSD